MLATMSSSLIVTESGPEVVDTQEAYAGDGDTLIHVSHSSVNYKDAMALSGDRGILRNLPMVPGIDVVGTLEDGTLVQIKAAPESLLLDPSYRAGRAEDRRRGR